MARREWWLLVPDQSVFASGGQTDGDVLHLAARHQDGKWVMVYLADKASFSVNMNKLAGAEGERVLDRPADGRRDAGRHASPTRGSRPFSTPDGWEDALLVLEPA